MAENTPETQVLQTPPPEENSGNPAEPQEYTYDQFVAKAYQNSQDSLHSRIEGIQEGSGTDDEKQAEISLLRTETAQSQAETIVGKPNPSLSEASAAIQKLDITPHLPVKPEELTGETKGEYLTKIQGKVIQNELKKFLELKNSPDGEKAIEYIQELLGAERTLSEEELAILNGSDVQKIQEFLEKNIPFEVLLKLAADVDWLRGKINKISQKIKAVEGHSVTKLTKTMTHLAESAGNLFVETADMEDLLNLFFDSQGVSGGSYRNSFLGESGIDRGAEGQKGETQMLSSLTEIFKDKGLGESFLKNFVWYDKTPPQDIFANNAAVNGLKEVFALSKPPEQQEILELKQRMLTAIEKTLPFQSQIMRVEDVVLTDAVLDFIYVETYRLTKDNKKQDKSLEPATPDSK